MASITNEAALTAAKLRRIIDYQPEWGVFRWIENTAGRKWGSVAGTITENGYRRIFINGRCYYASRLAWLYVYGHWPHLELDHRNGSRADDRIANLREATRSQNNACARPRRRSSHGVVGATKRGNKWMAQISHQSKRIWLGDFDTKEEAGAAYDAASKRLRGEFIRGECPLPPLDSLGPLPPLPPRIARGESVTYERLTTVLAYDQETGIFLWKPGGRRFGARHSGKMAGSVDGSGHRQIEIDGRAYMAGRLAWLYVHRRWPNGVIDHINLNGLDDRIANLREATLTQNAGNRGSSRGKFHPLKGVSYFQGKWRSWVAGKYLGAFDTPEEAHAAYAAAAVEHFGEFARAK